MKSNTAFYTERHEDSGYGANPAYDMENLYGARVLNRWMRTRNDRPLRVLDLGCGKGLFLLHLVRALKSRWNLVPSQVTGLDLISCEQNYYAEIPAPFQLIQHDTEGNPLPFADASFDFVSCNHVLEHIFETEHLVCEIRRVVAPDGFCVISLPNTAGWISRVGMLWGNPPLGSELGTRSVTYGFRPKFFQAHLAKFHPSGHIRDFTPRGLKDLTEACGFSTVGWWKQSKGFIASLHKWAGRDMGILMVPRSPASSA
jgi:SAM-dependent methyltransferase